MIDNSKVYLCKSEVKQESEETPMSTDRRMEMKEWTITTTEVKIIFSIAACHIDEVQDNAEGTEQQISNVGIPLLKNIQDSTG